MAKITISEGMNWKKTLVERHAELVGLRNQNSANETRYYGANADKSIDKKPVYNVVKLDKLITQVAREIRLVDNAIKLANAKYKLEYEQNDEVLGEVAE